MTESLLTDLTFESLDLEEPLKRGIKEAGFTYCTPIQCQSLPLALAGRDVQGQAQTGTGKTAAYLLASMDYLLKNPPSEAYQDGDPRAVILAPTRELAVQIHRDAEVLGRHTGLRLGLVFGGTGYQGQREMLKGGIDLLIATPGRLIDYHRQDVFSLRATQVVVLDEADRMFDLGFIKDIRFILRRMPSALKRLNLLFSATLSFRVAELAYEHMNDPVPVNVNPDSVTVDQVTQTLYHVSTLEKMPLLLGLLRNMEATRTIVFANTKRTAEDIAAMLEANEYSSGLLTGDVPQRKRLSLLERFTAGDLPVLVATDVAARGLHIPDISHVVNFDLPQDAEDYVHRVGRTARAGASGNAVSFACEEFVYSLVDIEAYIGDKLPVAPVRDELLSTVIPSRRRRRPRTDSRRNEGHRSPRHRSRRASSGQR